MFYRYIPICQTLLRLLLYFPVSVIVQLKQVIRVEMEVVDGGLKDMVSQLFEVLVSPAVPKSTREPLLTFGTSAAGGGGGGGGNSGSNNTTAAGSNSSNDVVTGVGGSSGAGGAVATGSSGSALGAGGDGKGGIIGAGNGGGSGAGGGGQEVGVGGGGGSGASGGSGGSIGGGGGGAEALVLDYGDVYEGKLYQRRSFVIVNNASMPLEFQLSSSLPASELNFSLSAVTLKQFKSVHVEAKTRLQVRDRNMKAQEE